MTSVLQFTYPHTTSAADEILALSDLSEICWQRSRRVRLIAHDRHGRRGCPTRRAPYSESDPTGAGAHSQCVADECLDVLHDLIIEVGRRLAERASGTSGAPFDPVRYAASVVPTVLTDRARKRRVALGLAAKPGRSDGRAAHVITRLRQVAPTVVVAEWYETLFRILRDYAHTEGRAAAGWPLTGLALEKDRLVAGSPPPASRQATSDIQRDIDLVLGIATRVAGRDWVRQLIWLPLSVGVLPSDAPDDMLAAGGAIEDEVISRWFQSEYQARRREGANPAEAFTSAARIVSGHQPDPPSPDIVALLEDFDAFGEGTARA